MAADSNLKGGTMKLINERGSDKKKKKTRPLGTNFDFIVWI